MCPKRQPLPYKTFADKANVRERLVLARAEAEGFDLDLVVGLDGPRTVRDLVRIASWSAAIQGVANAVEEEIEDMVRRNGERATWMLLSGNVPEFAEDA